MSDNMKGATFLCKDCDTIFIIGPNNLEYMSVYSCYNKECGSNNVEHRPDLRPRAMIDNTGARIV